MITMTFVSLDFRYPIRRPNYFQCSIPGRLICNANSLAEFATSGTNLVVYLIKFPTNDLCLYTP